MSCEKNLDRWRDMQIEIVEMEENGYRGIERAVTFDHFPNYKTKEFGILTHMLCKYDSTLIFGEKEVCLNYLESNKPFYYELKKNGIACEVMASDSKPIESLDSYELEFLGYDIVNQNHESVFSEGERVPGTNENLLCPKEEDFEKFVKMLSYKMAPNHVLEMWYVYRIVM